MTGNRFYKVAEEERACVKKDSVQTFSILDLCSNEINYYPPAVLQITVDDIKMLIQNALDRRYCECSCAYLYREMIRGQGEIVRKIASTRFIAIDVSGRKSSWKELKAQIEARIENPCRGGESWVLYLRDVVVFLDLFVRLMRLSGKVRYRCGEGVTLVNSIIEKAYLLY